MATGARGRRTTSRHPVAVHPGRRLPGSPRHSGWTGHDRDRRGLAQHADEPGSTTFAWETLARDGDLAVVRCVTTYPDGPKKGTYDNLWVIEFAPDGRAAEFTDWWIPGADPTPRVE